MRLIFSTLIAFGYGLFGVQSQNLFSGEGTFYLPNGGIGFCGQALQNSQRICAINANMLKTIPCGKCLLVTGPQGSTIVKVMDKCAACKDGDVDLAQGAFPAIAPLAAGRVKITSKVVPCPNGI